MGNRQERRVNKEELFVVLTQTNTLLASAIRKFTKSKYSHVSLSFNMSCREMYSFGRKYYYIPMYGTFKREDINDRIFAQRDDNMMAIYRLMVTRDEAKQIRRNIRHIKEVNRGFNVLGLAAAAFNVKLDRDKYYCAEFVHDAIHAETELLDQHPNAITPESIIGLNTEFELVYEGSVQDFIREGRDFRKEARRARKAARKTQRDARRKSN